MLGTLFGLIVLIFGLVLYFDPEARKPVNTELTPLLTAAVIFAWGGGIAVHRHRRST